MQRLAAVETIWEIQQPVAIWIRTCAGTDWAFVAAHSPSITRWVGVIAADICFSMSPRAIPGQAVSTCRSENNDGQFFGNSLSIPWQSPDKSFVSNKM